MRGALVLLCLIACEQEQVTIRRSTTSDYNYGALQKAIDTFVEAKRTPPAYQTLWKEILALRPGMDRATAQQAELSLVVLSLAPITAIKDRPMSEQVEALALTVWPILLAEEIEADEILRKRDPKLDEILPTKDETASTYIQRLCGKQLAADCKQIVPELQGSIVSALATRRGVERARNAVADCMLCSTEPGWKQAVVEWETLDSAVNEWVFELERRADPANWPIAGAASLPDPGLPLAELADTGEIVIGGQPHGASERVGALRQLRFLHGEDSPIALHIKPDVSLAALKGTLADVRKSGAKKIAVVARGAFYPWERRIYWLSDSAGVRVGLRQTDSLQLLLHAVDHLGQPGAVVRVD